MVFIDLKNIELGLLLGKGVPFSPSTRSGEERRLRCVG